LAEQSAVKDKFVQDRGYWPASWDAILEHFQADWK
jgi:hypothetical protein